MVIALPTCLFRRWGNQDHRPSKWWFNSNKKYYEVIKSESHVCRKKKIITILTSYPNGTFLYLFTHWLNLNVAIKIFNQLHFYKRGGQNRRMWVMFHTPIKLPTVLIIRSGGNNPNSDNWCTKHSNLGETTTAIRLHICICFNTKPLMKLRSFHHWFHAGISKYTRFLITQ